MPSFSSSSSTSSDDIEEQRETRRNHLVETILAWTMKPMRYEDLLESLGCCEHFNLDEYLLDLGYDDFSEFARNDKILQENLQPHCSYDNVKFPDVFHIYYVNKTGRRNLVSLQKALGLPVTLQLNLPEAARSCPYVEVKWNDLEFLKEKNSKALRYPRELFITALGKYNGHEHAVRDDSFRDMTVRILIERGWKFADENAFGPNFNFACKRLCGGRTFRAVKKFFADDFDVDPRSQQITLKSPDNILLTHVEAIQNCRDKIIWQMQQDFRTMRRSRIQQSYAPAADEDDREVERIVMANSSQLPREVVESEFIQLDPVETKPTRAVADDEDDRYTPEDTDYSTVEMIDLRKNRVRDDDSVSGESEVDNRIDHQRDSEEEYTDDELAAPAAALTVANPADSDNDDGADPEFNVAFEEAPREYETPILNPQQPLPDVVSDDENERYYTPSNSDDEGDRDDDVSTLAAATLPETFEEFAVHDPLAFDESPFGRNEELSFFGSVHQAEEPLFPDALPVRRQYDGDSSAASSNYDDDETTCTRTIAGESVYTFDVRPITDEQNLDDAPIVEMSNCYLSSGQSRSYGGRKNNKEPSDPKADILNMYEKKEPVKDEAVNKPDLTSFQIDLLAVFDQKETLPVNQLSPARTAPRVLSNSFDQGDEPVAGPAYSFAKNMSNQPTFASVAKPVAQKVQPVLPQAANQEHERQQSIVPGFGFFKFTEKSEMSKNDKLSAVKNRQHLNNTEPKIGVKRPPEVGGMSAFTPQKPVIERPAAVSPPLKPVFQQSEPRQPLTFSSMTAQYSQQQAASQRGYAIIPQRGYPTAQRGPAPLSHSQSGFSPPKPSSGSVSRAFAPVASPPSHQVYNDTIADDGWNEPPRSRSMSRSAHESRDRDIYDANEHHQPSYISRERRSPPPIREEPHHQYHNEPPHQMPYQAMHAPHARPGYMVETPSSYAHPSGRHSTIGHFSSEREFYQPRPYEMPSGRCSTRLAKPSTKANIDGLKGALQMLFASSINGVPDLKLRMLLKENNLPTDPRYLEGCNYANWIEFVQQEFKDQEVYFDTQTETFYKREF